ncbi:MAG TPA: type III pantothenate kinase [Dyella sp.]|nr:type III pantothenate kinase [Dyella sp.]
MRLLLDLGNTRLKWTARDDAGELAHGAVAWAEPMADTLREQWRNLPPVAGVFGASVVDAAREALVATQAMATLSRDVHWIRSPAAACGVRSAYADPPRLGVDRFLGMVAAHAAGMAPCVLVGVGTALTLDALAGDGRHLGGAIAPGPQLMRQSLLGATARVQPEQIGTVGTLADNTADAVASGCWGACAALVERFAAQVAPQLGGAPTLLFGGGDAVSLRALVNRPGELFIDGVLRGVDVWSRAAVPAVGAR